MYKRDKIIINIYYIQLKLYYDHNVIKLKHINTR
jgi:hypothetical protein